MIYYQYIATYTNNLQQSSTITSTRSCEDAEYNTHLLETKTIVKQFIKASNNNVMPSIVEQIETLTQTEFNNIVKGPDDLEINPDIPVDIII